MFESGHVWTATTGQGIFGFLLTVGRKSCVRPVCAVLVTAGPDVIRRSGPNQTLALDSAVRAGPIPLKKSEIKVKRKPAQIASISEIDYIDGLAILFTAIYVAPALRDEVPRVPLQKSHQ